MTQTPRWTGCSNGCRTTSRKLFWSTARRRLSEFVRGEECDMGAFKLTNGPKTIAQIGNRGANAH